MVLLLAKSHNFTRKSALTEMIRFLGLWQARMRESVIFCGLFFLSEKAAGLRTPICKELPSGSVEYRNRYGHQQAR